MNWRGHWPGFLVTFAATFCVENGGAASCRFDLVVEDDCLTANLSVAIFQAARESFKPAEHTKLR